MIDNDPKHLEVAYQAVVHKTSTGLAKRIEKLEEENRQLKENERILARNLSISEAQMVKLWDEILRLQDLVDGDT